MRQTKTNKIDDMYFDIMKMQDVQKVRMFKTMSNWIAFKTIFNQLVSSGKAVFIQSDIAEVFKNYGFPVMLDSNKVNYIVVNN